MEPTVGSSEVLEMSRGGGRQCLRGPYAVQANIHEPMRHSLVHLESWRGGGNFTGKLRIS